MRPIEELMNEITADPLSRLSPNKHKKATPGKERLRFIQTFTTNKFVCPSGKE